VKLTTHLHLEPSSKNEWSYTSTLQYAFVAWCSVKKQHRDSFTFTLCLTTYHTMKNILRLIKRHTMKTCGGVEVQLHTFLTSALLGWVVSFAPWPLYRRGRSRRYPLDRRLGGPQPSTDFRIKKLSLLGIELQSYSKYWLSCIGYVTSVILSGVASEIILKWATKITIKYVM